MSLRTIVLDTIKKNPSGSAEEIARIVFKKLPKSALFGLLVAEVARLLREEVREEEIAAYRKLFSNGESSSLPELEETMRALCGESFATGDGFTVMWGKATIEQHQQRIAMLEAMRDGIDRTIERHRQAIRLIEEAGVSCLADVKPIAA